MVGSAQRWRSPAAGSGSDAEADAGGSRLHCQVSAGSVRDDIVLQFARLRGLNSNELLPAFGG
jgi:hypothetical protein